MKYAEYDNEQKDYAALTDDERAAVDGLTDLYLECGELRSPELNGEHQDGFDELWNKYQQESARVGMTYRYRCKILHDMIVWKLEDDEETQTNFSKIGVDFVINKKQF